MYRCGVLMCTDGGVLMCTDGGGGGPYVDRQRMGVYLRGQAGGEGVHWRGQAGGEGVYWRGQAGGEGVYLRGEETVGSCEDPLVRYEGPSTPEVWLQSKVPLETHLAQQSPLRSGSLKKSIKGRCRRYTGDTNQLHLHDQQPGYASAFMQHKGYQFSCVYTKDTNQSCLHNILKSILFTQYLEINRV